MSTANEILHSADILMVLVGILVGTIGRLITLKIDYRQIPSYPNGYFINLVAGLIASALGAVAIPALISKDFAAITFLALAIEQFREIRKIEAESLEKLEDSEFTPRGEGYIDGIAKTFEARNYISMLASITAVTAMTVIPAENRLLHSIIGLTAGLLVLFLIIRFTKGKTVGDICTVKQSQITVEGSELHVDGISVTNMLGTDESRALFLQEGVGIVLEPRDDIYRITLDNYGQRQAILFEAVRTFGVKRYNFIRRSFSTGKVVLAFVPIINDIERIMEVVRKTPILENSRKVRRLIKNPIIGGK